jgi:N-acetyl sugar amidotransferase
MKYCKKCVNVDTRPDGQFDENGVCPACRFTEEKNNKEKVNWEERSKELWKIVEWGRSNTHSSYDCIVTVSGGKDSMRQAFYARDELGLKPLLVNSAYPPEQLHERGAYNLSNLVSHSFDLISMGLDPQVWKKMMRTSFFTCGNQAKSTEMALYAIPIHIAIAYKIPLVFLGENPLYVLGQQEGKAKGGNATGMHYSNTLQGGSPDTITPDGISKQDTYFYRYPADQEIADSRLRIVYLGYYIEDWSLMKNAELGIKKGMKIRSEPSNKTGDYFGFSALDEEFKIVNAMIKYIKYGYGAVTDQVIIAMNNGLLDRKQAYEAVQKYDGKCDQYYIDLFCDYLEISKNEFWSVVESYRGKDAWKKDSNGKWVLRAESPLL